MFKTIYKHKTHKTYTKEHKNMIAVNVDTLTSHHIFKTV